MSEVEADRSAITEPSSNIGTTASYLASLKRTFLSAGFWLYARTSPAGARHSSQRTWENQEIDEYRETVPLRRYPCRSRPLVE